MMAWKRWTPLLWPFLRIHVRFLGCTFPSKKISHPNRIRIQIEGSMNSVWPCGRSRYAGAEGEVYAHVCKKYGEPMLEVPQKGGYCWWTKSCTTKDVDYPIIYRVLTIPGGAGFCPSTVSFQFSAVFLSMFFFESLDHTDWFGATKIRTFPWWNPMFASSAFFFLAVQRVRLWGFGRQHRTGHRCNGSGIPAGKHRHIDIVWDRFQLSKEHKLNFSIWKSMNISKLVSKIHGTWGFVLNISQYIILPIMEVDDEINL